MKINQWNCYACGQNFRVRKDLLQHLKICSKKQDYLFKKRHQKIEQFCPYCNKKFTTNTTYTTHIKYAYCKQNPNYSEKAYLERSNKHRKAMTADLRKKASERAVFNNFWKYRSKNPILYESPIAGKMKLDSKWELLVAQRLDLLNVEWYRPKIRLPYYDDKGLEHGYFPDFYVKSFNCFIEVKSPFIANYQNSKNKCEYIKEHYKFVKWLETEDQCKSFELQDLGCDFIPEKEEDDPSFWITLKNSKKTKTKKCKQRKNQKFLNLKKERWSIIQSCNIDFTKFGWTSKLSVLFGISPNKVGCYIKSNFPEFYETCFIKQTK